MAKLPCRKKCPENMQRQCRLEFGYAGTPPCAKLAVKKFTGAQQLKVAIVDYLDREICSDIHKAIKLANGVLKLVRQHATV